MFNNKNSSSGVITVFLSLILVPMLSLGTLLAEVGRYRSAKAMLAEAQNVASLAVLADYNVYLHERFGLLAIDPPENKDSFKHDFESVLRINCDDVEDTNNPSNLFDIDTINCSSIYTLADYNVLQRQILEYSKYSVPYEVLAQTFDIKTLMEELTNKLLDKLGVNKAIDFLENMFKKTENSVSHMDKAFTELGRTEYQAFKLSNMLGDNKTKDDYTSELYDQYIKNDSQIGDLKIKEKYQEKHTAFINAVNELVKYINTYPNPEKIISNVKRKYNKELAKKFTTKEVTKRKYILTIVTELISKKDIPQETPINNKSVPIVYNDWYYSMVLNSETESVVYSNSSKHWTYKVMTAANNLLGKYPVEDVTEGMTVKFYSDLEKLVYVYFSRDKTLTEIQKECQVYLSNYYKKTAIDQLINKLEVEKIKWEKKIAGLKKDVRDTRDNYCTAINNLKTNYNNYNNSLGQSVSLLEKAKKEYEADSNSIESNGEKSEIVEKISNSGNVVNAINDVINDLKSKRKDLNIDVVNIMLSDLYNRVKGVNPDTINNGSIYSTNGDKQYLNNVNIGISSSELKKYVKCSFEKVAVLCNTKPVNAKETNIKLTKGNVGSATSGLTELWASFESVCDTLNPVPNPYDESYNASLTEKTTGLFNISKESGVNYQDQEYVDKMLNDVVEVLGESYRNQIMEELKGGDDQHSLLIHLYTLFDSIKQMKDELGNLFTLSIVEIVKAIKNIIGLVEKLIKTIGDIFKEFFSFVASLIKGAYFSVLISTYITQKFPSRMNYVSEAAVMEDDGSEEAQNFKGACVEYIIGGSPSETQNQSMVYFIIFGMRAIINAIQIFMDPNLMSIVSACNIFAVIAFLAFVYMESIIDMNLMVRLGKSVDFVKGDLHLSVNGLNEILGDFVTIESSKQVIYTTSGNGRKYHEADCPTMVVPIRNGTVNSTSIKGAIGLGFTACKLCKPVDKKEPCDKKDGILSMDYDKYLWMLLLFVGTENKVTRTGHLIQMETRYYEVKTKGSTNFRLDEAGTYVRSSVSASYDSLLPSFSLGENTNTFPMIGNLEYVGY